MILDLEQSQIRFKQPVKPADPDDVEDVGNPQLDDSDIKSIQDLVPDLISMMEAVGRREDFVKKLKSIADKTLDIQNIALSLLLDIGQFLNCNTVNSMRYHQTSLDFWSVFHKIFRGKGIRFMRGLKASKVDLDHDRPVKPTDCKLNFVVPSDRILIREALQFRHNACKPGEVLRPFGDFAKRQKNPYVVASLDAKRA